MNYEENMENGGQKKFDTQTEGGVFMFTVTGLNTTEL